MFRNNCEISFKLAWREPNLFALFTLSLKINRESTGRFFCTEKMTFFQKFTSKNKHHRCSPLRSRKFPIQVAKVPQCHKCSLISSQKFPIDVLKVPYERHKTSLSQKSSLFPSPKFPIFVTKVPFLLALSHSLTPSLSLYPLACCATPWLWPSWLTPPVGTPFTQSL